MASIPIVIIFTVVTNRPLVYRGEMLQQKKTEASTVLADTVEAIDTVKCYNAQAFELGRYVEKIKHVAYWYRKIVNVNGQQQGFVSFMASALFVQAFYYGGSLVRSGEKSSGDIVTTFLSALSVFSALNAINAQMLVLEMGRLAGISIAGVLSQLQSSATSPIHDQVKEKSMLTGDILFDHVSFSYPTGQNCNVIKGLNMVLPLGQLSFIVGSSGSGKSTLGQLLTRMYEAQDGTVSISGNDIRNIDIQQLRQTITLVEQTSVLFQDTIGNNISLARIGNDPSPSETELQSAIEFACLTSTLADMPENDDTCVGNGGDSVSGGQRQRIALARAYIRDSPILILDESTSALDPYTRLLIMDSIRRWRRLRTTIIITHDLESIAEDENVYVLKDGELVQQGLKKDLAYFRQDNDQPVGKNSVDFDNSEQKIAYAVTEADSMDELNVIDSYNINYLSRRQTRVTKTWSYAVPTLNRMTFDFGSAVWLPPPTIIREQIEQRSNSSASDEETIKLFGLSNKVDHDVEKSNVQVTQTKDFEKDQKVSTSLVKSIDRAKTSFNSLWDILKTVWPVLTIQQRLVLILAFILCIIHAAASPILSLLTTRLMGTYSYGPASSKKALMYAMIILLVAAIEGLAHYGQEILFEAVAQVWVNKVRKKAVERLLDQPREFFSREENSSSHLVEILDRYADEARNIVGRFVPLYIMVITLVLISITWALAEQWKLTLVTLSFFPIIIGATKLFGIICRKYEGQSNEAASKINLIFSETFSCIRTVKLLTLEKYFTDKVIAACDVAHQVGFKRAMTSGIAYGFSDATQTFAQAGIFYYGARLVVDGATVSHVILVLLMLIMAFTQVTLVLGMIPQISLARDSASRFLALANLNQLSHEYFGMDTEPDMSGDIEFCNISFQYPSRQEQKVLSSVSFTIPNGKYVAIVGTSGSGKSTIANLLLRLYKSSTVDQNDAVDPYTQTGIFISGRNINRFQTTTLRKRIALVRQNDALLVGSIAQNIAYGVDLFAEADVTSKVRSAAEAAGLAEFIMSLPQGYETLIGGQGGQGLSGGQQQRLAIARALFREPDVLILDESTSALDGDSVEVIKMTCKKLVQDNKMTVVVVTHDARMVNEAQWIIVLEKGKVVQEGESQDLLDEDHGGELSRLFPSLL